MFFVVLTCLASLSSPVWTPVLDNLRSICFRNQRMGLTSMPSLFKTASKCRYALIAVVALGTAEQPVVLHGSTAFVSRLFSEQRAACVHPKRHNMEQDRLL